MTFVTSCVRDHASDLKHQTFLGYDVGKSRVDSWTFSVCNFNFNFNY
jgi:hypothetical protein